MLIASLNMSNIISTKGGVLENIDYPNDIYRLSDNINEVNILRQGKYRANDFYYGNQFVKHTVDSLINEPYFNLTYNFKKIYDYLLKYNDSFLNFYDMENLTNLRINLGKKYLDKENRVKSCIDNAIWADKFDLQKEIKNKFLGECY